MEEQKPKVKLREGSVHLNKPYKDIDVLVYGPGLRKLKDIPEWAIKMEMDDSHITITTKEVVLPAMTITAKATMKEYKK